ncbi:hypothetical protein ACFPFX_27320 [Streptomyces mauvecolor]|uniref:Uncharacterized protein n=1 Tax=Streptomyces mauvecolor TaxID=58345 RepID=A0ABV9US42_9ACTN
MTGRPGTAVADSFALYRIVSGHGPGAAVAREAALGGSLRLLSPVVAVAVAAGMRDCWDEACDERHGFLGHELVTLCRLSGLETGLDDPGSAVEAGRLYAASTALHIDGPEVLAACHAAGPAARKGCALLTAARAAYCYRSAREAGLRLPLRAL